MKNEIVFNWSMALTLTWAIFWRWVIVGIIPVIVFSVFIQTVEIKGLIILLLQMFLLPLLGLFISVKWLLSSGRFGSIKIIFMEQAHYQEKCKEERLASSKSIQPTGNSQAD
ncbi:MAG: hypothetical protein U9N57_03865 [Pseudomonadota bacterium]|nr:hypothetical protein [Pseudomonadota bacterium]